MNRFYDKIMELKCADDLKEIVRNWQRLSENIKYVPNNAPVIIPDMLWIINSGAGKTYLLNLVANYLFEQKNVMEFYGEIKFFEFLLSYCSENEQFSEMHRLIDEVSRAAGFRSEYKGIVCIDIDEWIDHCDERHFISLMEYLSSHSESWLIIFTVSENSYEKINHLETVLTTYLRIKKLILPMPETENFFAYLCEQLKSYGFTLDTEAEKLIKDTIDALRKNSSFDGYKTINRLCSDIVYCIFSSENFSGFLITGDIISEFSKNSAYIQRTIETNTKTRSIGFSLGE